MRDPFRQDLLEQVDRLDVAPRPAEVRGAHQADAGFRGGVFQRGFRLREHEYVGLHAFGPDEVAFRFAARDLQVNQPFGYLIDLDQAAKRGEDLLARQR